MNKRNKNATRALRIMMGGFVLLSLIGIVLGEGK